MHTTRNLIVVSLLLSMFIPHTTSASCLYQTPEQLLTSADIVVEGKVTDVVVSPESTTVVADVQEVIKGEVGDTVSFITGSGSQVVTSVDVFFEVGATYSLYLLRNEEGLLTTTSCAGTHELAASSSVTDVNESTDIDLQPMSVVDPSEPPSAMPWIISGIIVVISLGVMVSIAMHGRKRM